MKKGFDSLAPVYDALARIVFGKAMVNSQACFLNRLQECETVLVLGGGTGWWVNEVLERYNRLRITFIDASAEMIRIAETSSNFRDRVVFIQGTQQSIPKNNKFDAVVLFYFADLFEDHALPQVIEQIKSNLHSDALWLVTDFTRSRWWHRWLLKIMYTFFRITTGLKTKRLADWKTILSTKDLKQVDQRYFYRSFICSTVYEQ